MSKVDQRGKSSAPRPPPDLEALAALSDLFVSDDGELASLSEGFEGAGPGLEQLEQLRTILIILGGALRDGSDPAWQHVGAAHQLLTCQPAAAGRDSGPSPEAAEPEAAEPAGEAGDQPSLGAAADEQRRPALADPAPPGPVASSDSDVPADDSGRQGATAAAAEPVAKDLSLTQRKPMLADLPPERLPPPRAPLHSEPEPPARLAPLPAPRAPLHSEPGPPARLVPPPPPRTPLHSEPEPPARLAPLPASQPPERPPASPASSPPAVGGPPPPPKRVISVPAGMHPQRMPAPEETIQGVHAIRSPVLPFDGSAQPTPEPLGIEDPVSEDTWQVRQDRRSYPRAGADDEVTAIASHVLAGPALPFAPAGQPPQPGRPQAADHSQGSAATLPRDIAGLVKKLSAGKAHLPWETAASLARDAGPAEPAPRQRLTELMPARPAEPVALTTGAGAGPAARPAAPPVAKAEPVQLQAAPPAGNLQWVEQPSQHVSTLPGMGSPSASLAHIHAINLEQYAYLRAECEVFPDRISQAHARLKLQGDDERRVLDELWKERIGQDPTIRSRFEQLTTTYRAWLKHEAE